jgi:hypothetical protein
MCGVRTSIGAGVRPIGSGLRALMDDRRRNETDRDLDAERRLSEEDGWLSASDQTLSDRSRAQSDRDQDAADYDQVAAELEREGGVGSAQRDQSATADAGHRVKKNAGDPARARRLAGLVNRCARLSETPSFSRPERSRVP